MPLKQDPKSLIQKAFCFLAAGLGAELIGGIVSKSILDKFCLMLDFLHKACLNLLCVRRNANAMTKKEALELFGGAKKTADALGITVQAVCAWPERLPRRISDRVLGAAYRAGVLPPRIEQCDKGAA